MVHILDLNLDVVHTILSYVNQKDMLRLATTCTSLYEPVMERRLARIDIGCFTKRDQLRKYCDYMLHDARRPQYLTNVTISHWPDAHEDTDDYCEAELLTRVIHHAARLTALKCCMHSDGCRAAQSLLDAITSITTLTSVELALHDEDMLRVLSSLKSDPYQLTCWFLSPREGTASSVPPPPFLDRFAAASHLHTLELVDASPFLFECGLSDDIKALPSVRKLTITQSTPLNLHLASRVFPNVETLCLSQPTGTNEPQIPFAWPSVDYLSTNFALAITSHVRHVSVAAPTQCTQSYRTMLHCTSPSVLECYVDRAYLQAVALLPQPVRFLQLRIVASLNEGLREYLHDYLAILRDVPLVAFTLMLPVSLKRSGDHASVMREMCAWIASSIPSLKFVGLAWFTYSRKSGRGIDSSSWFKIAARPERDRPSLVTLSGSEGDSLYIDLLGSARFGT